MCVASLLCLHQFIPGLEANDGGGGWTSTAGKWGPRCNGRCGCTVLHVFQVLMRDCVGVHKTFGSLHEPFYLPQLTFNRDSGLDVSNPKHGKVHTICAVLVAFCE